MAEAAAKSLVEAPVMFDWYNEYYAATRASAVYAEFCRRLYGDDFSQHGFAGLDQLHRLLEVSGLGPGKRALDLGCGNGAMAAYMAATTGAHVTGLDYSPVAIAQAQERAAAHPAQLAFVVGSMADVDFPPESFDLILAIDTLYFVEDHLDDLLPRLARMLKPQGKIAAYYTQAADPMVPVAVFDRATLPPAKTVLGQALARAGLRFQTWDVSAEDCAHARRKKALLEELAPRFAAEGVQFLHDNRYGEACGVIEACEAGAHARYLYLIEPS